MNKFSEEELIRLHDCLKTINIANYKIDYYYVDVLKELMNRISTEEQLATYIFMTHDSLLSLISGSD